MPHQSTALALRTTTFLSSLLLVILSAVTFYYTASAFKRLATSFPADKYVWHGAATFDANKNWNQYHMVYLTYDWSTENFIWVAAGSSIVAGVLGLFGSGIRWFGKVNVIPHCHSAILFVNGWKEVGDCAD
jgi:hypothetical protein